MGAFLFGGESLASSGGGCRFQLFYWPAVDTGQRIPADEDKLFEHFQAISQVADAGAFVVSPGDGHFANGISALDGDEENFRVEAPALDALQLKDGLRRLAGEGLEAAL